MDFAGVVKQYWPFMALLLWFGYKWWNARRIRGMLPALKSQGAVLIDVRSAAEFASGNAPGSVNIPLPELGGRLQEIPRAVPVVVCCASGTRSGMAKMVLKKNGYQNVFNIGAWSNLR